MDTKNLIEQRNALLTKMQAIKLGDKFGPEERSSFDAMNADLAIVDGDITRFQAFEKIEAEQRSAVRPNRAEPGAAIEADSVEKQGKEVRSALTGYMRTGRIEERAITTLSSGPNGGALIPQAFYGILTDAQKYYGPISTVVGSRKDTSGEPLKIALSNDVTNTFTIQGEATAISEVDPAYQSKTLSVDTVNVGLVQISRQELQDSYFDLDSWIRTKFAVRYARGLEGYITNGNSSNVASLITSAYAAVTATGNNGTTGATGTGANSIGYDDIAALHTALDPAYLSNAKWSFTSKTLGFLLGVKDGFGRPLFIPNPSSGAFDSLLGHQIVLNQALPQIAASAVGTVLFGDFAEGYLLRQVGDLEIVRMDERFAELGLVGFTGWARLGGCSMDAGTHPIVALSQSAS